VLSQIVFRLDSIGLFLEWLYLESIMGKDSGKYAISVKTQVFVCIC